MSEEKVATPQDDIIDYNDTDVARLGQFPVCKEGWFRFVVTAWKKQDSKNNNLQLLTTCKPMTEDESPGDVTAQLRLMPPISNPRVEGHTPPNTKLGCWFFAMALDQKFPRYPKKLGGGKFDHNGETIDMATNKQVAREVDSAILKTAKDWYNDPNALIDETFYGLVEHSEGTDGRIYANIERTRFTPPDDAPVISSDFKM